MADDAPVLGSASLIAIVRFHEGGELLGALEALAHGGIDLLEVTLDTPGALGAVEQAAGAGRTVGVGTVLSAEHVRACAAAGARFVVSPGFIAEVMETARDLGVEPMPGVFTATEILEAAAAGARVLKLFPAGGPSYLRVLRGPFPTTPLVPTGGIRLDEIQPYLEAGATAVGLGSELVGRSAPRSDRDLEWIAAQAARAVAAARRTVAAAAAPGGDGREIPVDASPRDRKAAASPAEA
jgi:2-dehydro-3-deoxyphosphogluconate aldolase/(4S)-4-hydroxy-2-oxoglutarate aldolase